MEFGVFVLTIKYFLEWFAKIVLGTIIIVICMSAVVPLLPDDPFRSDILTISATFDQWSDFLNWMIPTNFIVTSGLFAANCKLFFYITRIVLNRIGGDFFEIFGSRSKLLNDDKY